MYFNTISENVAEGKVESLVLFVAHQCQLEAPQPCLLTFLLQIDDSHNVGQILDSVCVKMGML